MVVGGADSGNCCSCGGVGRWFYLFFFFNGGGRQRLVVGVGLQRKWWVFRERERQIRRERRKRERNIHRIKNNI